MVELVSAYQQLRPVERVFVEAYLSELQSSAAAAGQRVIDFIQETGQGTAVERRYAREKVSTFHADAMMRKPLVRAAIAERVDQLTRAMQVDAYKVLKEVSAIAFSSVEHYLDVADFSAGTMIDFSRCTPEQLSAVQSVKTNRDGIITEFKLHSKLDAIEKLMKYMNMYEQENKPVVEGYGAPVPRIKEGTTTEQAADLYARTLTTVAGNR